MNTDRRYAWFMPRNMCFMALFLLTAGIAQEALLALLRAAFRYDPYTHSLLVLPVSAALLYLDRNLIFRQVRYNLLGALALGAAAAGLLGLGRAEGMAGNDHLSLSILLLVFCWTSAFLLCYGFRAFRAAAFPLAFLVLMVPIPGFLLDRTIWILQRGSADVTYFLLRAAQVPVLRRDVLLSLPGFDIEVAQECSGIRSTLMLLMVNLVLAQLFLRSAWRKVLLTLAVFPITIIKNGLRIFALSTLAQYVDSSFLTGRLHHYGGIPFFGLALGSLMLMLWVFHRSERGVGAGLGTCAVPAGDSLLVKGNP